MTLLKVNNYVYINEAAVIGINVEKDKEAQEEKHDVLLWVQGNEDPIRLYTSDDENQCVRQLDAIAAYIAKSSPGVVNLCSKGFWADELYRR